MWRGRRHARAVVAAGRRSGVGGAQRLSILSAMRLLITGGAGFIGSNFARYWSARHPDDVLVVLDVLTYAGNRENLSDLEADGRVAFVHVDICDQGPVESTIGTYGIDTIVNFAAESHNSLAVLDPGRFFRTNVLGTQVLCDAARRLEVPRFHHISTCEVYGDLDLDSDEAFKEDSPYRPRTPYNASKAGADHVVRCYVETFGLRATITNCCNNYGPYQFPEKVIPLFVTRALKGESLPLYASTKNRREWLHVDDHCSAVEAALDRGRIGETYLVGSGREASIEEIADIVLAATGQSESLKTIVPDRPGHDRRYLLDSTKIRTELGWAPAVDFDAGIAAVIGWYRQHPDWWEPLIGRSPVIEDAWSKSVPIVTTTTP
jgi:dTDP-glucose 4,6-dehydratase